MPKIDLHLHSTCSDGKLAIADLAELIKKSGLKYCSLTDHDTVSGIADLQKCLEGSGVNVIPGLELTALFKQQEIHILAYGFNTNGVDTILQEKQKITDQKKTKELELAKKIFEQNGFFVSDGLKITKNKPVGLIIALDIYNNPKNTEKINGLSPEQFYNNYQAPGAPCYVERSGVAIKWVIKNFRGECDNLILAHPFNPVSLLIKPLTIKDIECLVGLGLDGIEVYHPGLSDEQINTLKEMASKNHWNYTGGSDFHGKKNINEELGVVKKDYIIDSFKLYGY